MAQCDTRQIVVHQPKWDMWAKAEKKVDVTVTMDWSGGCDKGQRDGEGTLTWVEDSTDITQFPDGSGTHTAHSVRTYKSQGRFVKGQRLGLWCTDSQLRLVQSTGKPTEWSTSHCQILSGHGKPLTGAYQKQADGSWQEVQGFDVPTGTTLPPGTLEGQSAQLLASAGRSGSAPQVPLTLAAQNHMLDDLVAGARITLAISRTPIDFYGKRIGVVLSSATLTEMERYRRERDALLAASAGLTGDAAQARARFIAASDPDRLLVNVAKALRGRVGSIHAADDLAGLQQGKIDYALVIDWKPKTRLDLLGRFDKVPAMKLDASYKERADDHAPSAVACPAFGFFVIDPSLRAVQSSGGAGGCSHKHGYHARGDEGYMNLLANAYEGHWGRGIDDIGWQIKMLEYVIK